MLEYIFLLILALIAAFYFNCFFLPARSMKRSKELYEKLGYKVYMYDFLPLNAGIVVQRKRDIEEHNDALYTVKKKWCKADIVIWNLLNKPIIEFVHPSLIKEFLSPDHPTNYEKLVSFSANLKRVLGRGVVFSERQEWKNKRKLISSVFNHQFIKANVPKIVSIIKHDMAVMEALSLEKNGDLNGVFKYDYTELWMRSFSNVILSCFFGGRDESPTINGQPACLFLAKINEDVNKQTADPVGMLLGVGFLKLGWRKFDASINERIKIVRNFALNLIQQRIKEIESAPKEGSDDKVADFVDALLKKNQLLKSKNSEEHYDYKELVEEFCTFYTAGADTSSHMLTMLLNYMVLHPEVLVKVRKQVETYIKTEEDITMETMKEMTYIDCVINETLRCYGPGNGLMLREARFDHYLKNIPIKKGQIFCQQPMGNHYNEKYFEDPWAFNPDRWLKSQDHLPPYAFMGFSGGPRACLGKQLSLVQSKIALILFLRRYEHYDIPKKDFKMLKPFLYSPENMISTMTLKKSQ